MSKRLLAELKQTKPFPSVQGAASVALLRTAAVLDYALNEALKPHGLTGTQYNVLRILRGAGEAGLCGREVGERMIAPVPDVTRMLDRMELAALVKRERSTEDRRHVTVRLAPKGRRRLDEVERELEALERRFMSKVSTARLKQVIDTLDDMRGS